MYPPPPPPPPIVYIWYHIFAGPKRNFEKNNRKQNLLWNNNSCDLDAQLETWTAFIYENLSSNTAGASQFLTDFHNPNQITRFWAKFKLITKFHNSDKNSQFWSVWCGGLETVGGGVGWFLHLIVVGNISGGNYSWWIGPCKIIKRFMHIKNYTVVDLSVTFCDLSVIFRIRFFGEVPEAWKC